MKEALAIQLLCAALGGEQEVRHAYQAGALTRYIRVDCESAEFVMEMGLDKRSSYDSLHQALFAAQLTGKAPQIVIIDTDLIESPAEYQIRTTAERAGVSYKSFYINELVRLLELPGLAEQLGIAPDK